MFHPILNPPPSRLEDAQNRLIEAVYEQAVVSNNHSIVAYYAAYFAEKTRLKIQWEQITTLLMEAEVRGEISFCP